MINQRVLPAIKHMKDFEYLLKSDTEYIILLDTRLGLLKKLVKAGQKAGKRILIHVDLIQGLKADEYGMEFLGREVRPDGVISTRTSVIQRAKKYGLITVQRLFLIDSQAIDHNVKIIKKAQPDFVEVLPGILPGMIQEIKDRLGVPIIAGGLIRTGDEVEEAIRSGVSAVTTSRKDLWEL
ncbi:glycerol-3-phosphate responsive antiterminator [Halobacillus hunanensis]|uniref:glycerol-3-phosphate responsive antiterminator n=1 Tax=Halobacillus hunanensis TaxID=578214 RepID=UPI0009A80CB0|nr:glycerol-3-phosphate responsive antiterminator [Halobacillus hunanensis]